MTYLNKYEELNNAENYENLIKKLVDDLDEVIQVFVKINPELKNNLNIAAHVIYNSVIKLAHIHIDYIYSLAVKETNKKRIIAEARALFNRYMDRIKC